MAQRINDRGLALLKGREKCVLRAYRDQGARGGVWTIGWGHTGPEVVEGLYWSQEEADEALKADLANAERAVNSYVLRTLNENQFSALVVFVFNIGSGAFFESSVLTYLNHDMFDQACAAMALYDKQRLGGPSGPLVFSQGLANRRAEEQALFRLPVTPEVYGPPVPPGWDQDPRNPQKKG